MYPKRDITNIVESSHYLKIGSWCRAGSTSGSQTRGKCKTARWVKPFRCLGKYFHYSFTGPIIRILQNTLHIFVVLLPSIMVYHNFECVQYLSCKNLILSLIFLACKLIPLNCFHKSSPLQRTTRLLCI